jgi:hypothetical protein
MGWNAEAILALFRDPTHPALRGMWLILGEDGIRRRISAALQTRGVYQLRSTIHEAPDEPDVVSIGGLVGRPRRPEEVSHASGL